MTSLSPGEEPVPSLRMECMERTEPKLLALPLGVAVVLDPELKLPCRERDGLDVEGIGGA